MLHCQGVHLFDAHLQCNRDVHLYMASGFADYPELMKMVGHQNGGVLVRNQLLTSGIALMASWKGYFGCHNCELCGVMIKHGSSSRERTSKSFFLGIEVIVCIVCSCLSVCIPFPAN